MCVVFVFCMLTCLEELYVIGSCQESRVKINKC